MMSFSSLLAKASAGHELAVNTSPMVESNWLTWFFVVVGLLLFLLMVPALYRVIAGPTAIDRIVAVNIIGTKTAVLIVVIGAVVGKAHMYVDFALAYALLNFVGSLAASRYLRKTKPMAGGAVPIGESVVIKEEVS